MDNNWWNVWAPKNVARMLFNLAAAAMFLYLLVTSPTGSDNILGMIGIVAGLGTQLFGKEEEG